MKIKNVVSVRTSPGNGNFNNDVSLIGISPFDNQWNLYALQTVACGRDKCSISRGDSASELEGVMQDKIYAYNIATLNF